MIDRLNVLILNKDLPVFPGWMSHEFLHTIGFRELNGKVGLVSQIHTQEQLKQACRLREAGVTLFAWKNEAHLRNLDQRARTPTRKRRLVSSVYDFARTFPSKPFDTSAEDICLANMSGALVEALSRERWHIFVVIQSSSAHCIDRLPPFPFRVLVLHDIRSLVYQRRAEIESNPIGRYFYATQARRYYEFEKHYCRKYDLIVTVSEEDKDWVESNYRPKQCVAIPLLIDSDYFSPEPDVASVAGRIVFSGMMNHPPNADAACYFADSVFPLIRREVPDAEFWIVGRDPTPRVLGLKKKPGIHVTAFVDDIRPYVRQAELVVAPIRFGSGARNKILEAWSMEKSVVATSIGAEGLRNRNGARIIIADTPVTMANRIVHLMNSSYLRSRIEKQCRDHVVSNHQAAALQDEYFPVLREQCIGNIGQEKPETTLIDLRWLYPGIPGGAENLARSFLNELKRIDASNRYPLLVTAETQYEYSIRNSPNFKSIVVNGPRRGLQKLGASVKHRLLSRLRLPSATTGSLNDLQFLNASGADVSVSIPGYIAPDLYPLRNVLIALDVQHLEYPEFFSAAVREERDRVYGDSIRKADFVLAISEFTRTTILKHFHLSHERIETAWPSVDPIFQQGALSTSVQSSVLQKYQLPQGEYLFFPAHTWIHKNHRSALKGLSILRDLYRMTPLLVCCGNPRDAQPEIDETVRRLGLEHQVRFLGYVPGDHMPALYRSAAALVFPSLYEGFGFPVIEAMSSGCPVVCSNHTSLPEIAGDAALLVNAADSEALAEAVYRILTDSNLRTKQIERGTKRAGLFSWEKFTARVLRACHEVRKF